MSYIGTQEIKKAYLGSREMTSSNSYIGTYKLIGGQTPVVEPIIPNTYFYVRALQNTCVKFRGLGSNDESNLYDRNLVYSLNYDDWETYTNDTEISLNKNDVIFFKRNGSAESPLTGKTGYFAFGNGQVAVGGNVASILDGVNCTTWVDEISSSYNFVFCRLFKECTSLVDASELILPFHKISASNCYNAMFDGCTNLTKVPKYVLAREITGSACFYAMFRGCTSLVSGMTIYATSVTSNGCMYMYENCPNLTNMTIYTDNGGFDYWLSGNNTNGTLINYGSSSPSLPSNWTRDNRRQELCVEPNGDSAISVKVPYSYSDSQIQYSIDGGSTWVNNDEAAVTVNVGEKLYIRRNSTTPKTHYDGSNKQMTIGGGTAKVSGNFASVYSSNYKTLYDISSSSWDRFAQTYFAFCTNLTDAEDLYIPFFKLGDFAIQALLRSTSISKSPVIWARHNSAGGAFNRFYQECPNLTIVSPNFMVDNGSATFTNYVTDASAVTRVDIYATSISNSNNWMYGQTDRNGVIVNNGMASLTQNSEYGVPRGWTEYKWKIASAALKKIFYTSTDGQVVTPYDTSAFGGLTIVSNTYTDGLGTITFSDNLTTVGNNAFSGCTTLATIQLPKTVTSIGNYTFEFCSGLTSISFTNKAGHTSTLASIGNFCFFGCSSLTTVTIPNTVTSIGEDCFNNCLALSNVTLSNNCNTIPYAAFKSCNFSSINLPANVKTIGSFAFYSCNNLTSINLNNVTSIGERAFSQTNLTNVTLSNSLTTLNANVFGNCTSLNTITLGSNLTNINATAFDDCFALNSITYNNDIAHWNSVTKGTNWYGDIPAVYVHCNDGNVLIRNNHLLYTTSDNQVATIASDWGVNVVSNTYTDGVGLIVFDANLTSIPSNAFQQSSTLTNVVYPATVTSITDNAFYKCNALSGVTILPTVTSLGSYAFYQCRSLTAINVPNTITAIPDFCFSECNSLTGLTLPTTITTIGERALNNVKATSYNLPNLTTIGNSGFRHNANLSSLTVSSSLTSWGDWAFEDTPALTHIDYNGTVAQWNAITKGSSWGTNSALLYVATTQGDYALHSFKLVYFASSQATIGSGSWGANVNTHTFASGKGIVNFDGNVTSVPSSGLAGNTTVTEYIMPKALTSISSYAFDGNTALNKLLIPVSVVAIGNYVFNDCTSLTSFNYEGTMAEWNAIEKAIDWNTDSNLSSIKCSDGTIILTERDYFCITANEASTVSMNRGGDSGIIDNLYYNLNNGNWVSYTENTSISMAAGDELRWFRFANTTSSVNVGQFTIIGDVTLSGNINSFLSNDFENLTDISGYSGRYGIFGYMFDNSRNTCHVTNAENLRLPATVLGVQAYRGLLQSTPIYTSPDIPKATMAQYCFGWMFNGCSNLNRINSYVETYSSSYFNSWVGSVPATGLFCNYGGASFSTGSDGIPNGWTETKAVITYTSSDGNIVVPNTTSSSDWGANIISNTYSDGKGQILFDGVITTIPADAFKEKSTLTSVILPKGITSLGINCFLRSNCTSIVCSDGLLTQNVGAMGYTPYLTAVTLPASITSVGQQLFWQDSQIIHITYGGTVAQWNALSKGYGWNYYSYQEVHHITHCIDGDVTN